MQPSRLKVGAALVLAAPFVPMLFQGEEWGATTPFPYFTDHDDPQLARAVTEGRRKEGAAFGWRPEDVPDPQSPETFERSKLNWDERERWPHAELLEWHRRLIRLRGSLPALTDGRLDGVRTRFDETARWFVLRRGPVAVVCNLADRGQRVPAGDPGGWTLLLASASGVRRSPDGVALPPDSVAILASGGPA